MWSSLISFALPIATKILSAYFEDKNADADARSSYLKFLESMQKSSATPAKHKASYDDQVQRLKDLWREP